MTAIEFLRKKEILGNDETHFIIRYPDCKEIDVVDLLNEFVEENKELTPLQLSSKCGFPAIQHI